MTDFERWSLLISAIQGAAVVPTLVFAGYQLWQQKREMKRNRSVMEYEVYQRIVQANTELLWRSSVDPSLDAVWDPRDPARQKQLDDAQDAQRWGAWYVMNEDERRAYGYTHSALDLLEQAWDVWRRGIVSNDVWAKWESWADIWPRSRYFRYVWEDERERFLPGFVAWLEQRLPGKPSAAHDR